MSVKYSTIQQLVALAHTAPSADNSQPWHFMWDGTCLSLKYDFQRVAGKTFPASSPATLLSMGAVIEIIMMAATDWQMSPELQLSENPGEDNGNYATFTFGRESSEIADVHPAATRHTNRHAYQVKQIPDEIGLAQEKLREGSARCTLITDRANISQISHIVRIASEIRFRTKEVHQWLERSLRFSQASASQGDGMDVSTLGLPPGGKLFLRLICSWNRMYYLNKIWVYKLVSAIDSAPVKSAPGLIAITSRASPRGTLDAGRLLARSWIGLNQDGLAVHPYYVIADQLARHSVGQIPEELIHTADKVEKLSLNAFSLKKEDTLHMLLRVGYPKKQAVLSQRLPLSNIFHSTVNE